MQSHLDLIDHEDESLLCDNQEIVSDVPSDHNLIICSLDLPRPNPTKMATSCGNLHQINIK